MSLCVEKLAAVECEYASDVARCDVDMNGTCQLDAGVLCCANSGVAVLTGLAGLAVVHVT